MFFQEEYRTSIPQEFRFKMIELLRNCAHGSEVATYLAHEQGEPKRIIKTAYTRKGCGSLLSEREGLAWYGHRLEALGKSSIAHHGEERAGFFRLETEYLKGRLPNYHRALKHNHAVIDRVIDHYIELWPRGASGNVPIHGDYSLGNAVIVDDGTVRIIDWEHFRENAAFWGFDAAYLLLEALFYSSKKNNSLNDQEIDWIAFRMDKLHSTHPLPPELRSSPLGFLVDFIQQNADFWGEQALKFPITLFDKDQARAVDQRFRSRNGAIA